MRNQLIFSLFTVWALASCQNQEKEESDGEILRLPLTFVEGFGPAGYSYSILSEEYSKDDPAAKIWIKTYLPVKGIPESWRGVKKSMVSLGLFQMVYQNYKAGNITKEELNDLAKSWKWEPNPEELSAEPIKCYVYAVSGRDKDGLIAVILDANNNLDFSDDEVFYPKACGIDSTMRQYSEDEKHYINYEVYQAGKVIIKQVPMIVKRTSIYPLIYVFPQYATAELKVKGKVHNIVLNGSGRPDYTDSQLVLVDGDNKLLESSTERVNEGELLSVGGLFDKVKYRNRGVNMYQEVLQLESEYAEKIGYSLQTGYPFQPFTTKIFKSDKAISSLDYKGKYLFIDFWGTWCGPCVAELPELQRIYEGVDKQRVEFISIAGEQSPELLERFLKKRPLAWPQIISDDENKLIETYNIDGYPTNVLVGPDGRIVAKNLHGQALEEKLAELTKK